MKWFQTDYFKLSETTFSVCCLHFKTKKLKQILTEKTKK